MINTIFARFIKTHHGKYRLNETYPALRYKCRLSIYGFEQQFILALNEKIVEFKFSSITAPLAKTDILAVYKNSK